MLKFTQFNRVQTQTHLMAGTFGILVIAKQKRSAFT